MASHATVSIEQEALERLAKELHRVFAERLDSIERRVANLERKWRVLNIKEAPKP